MPNGIRETLCYGKISDKFDSYDLPEANNAIEE